MKRDDRHTTQRAQRGRQRTGSAITNVTTRKE